MVVQPLVGYFSARTKAALNSAETETEMVEIFDNFLADTLARQAR